MKGEPDYMKYSKYRWLSDVHVFSPVRDCRVVKVEPDKEELAKLMKEHVKWMKKNRRENLLIDLACYGGFAIILFIFYLCQK